MLRSCPTRRARSALVPSASAEFCAPPVSFMSQAEEPAIAYGPTLFSAGGYAALRTHLSPVAPALIAAIVPDPVLLKQNVPGFGGDVYAVHGHIQGYRTLRDLLRSCPAARVIALHNPVIPFPRIDVSVIQNSYLVRPVRSMAFHPYISDWPRLVAGSFATSLQVIRSPTTIALNPNYPRYWNHVTNVRVQPNQLELDQLRYGPSTERSATVVFVGSFDRFRGLHIAIRSFVRSRLAESGWTLVVHARGGNRRYESYCRRLAEEGSAVHFAEPNADAQESLCRAAAALFPSRLEASSIAFLEALHLRPEIVAFDGKHFRSAASDAYDASLYWVRGWNTSDWACMLQSVARRLSQEGRVASDTAVPAPRGGGEALSSE